MININDITLGQYAPRDSVVHKLDPRTKVLLSFFLMLLFLWIRNFELLFLFFIILLGFFSLSKLHIGLALRNLKPFLILFLFTCLLHVFFTGGKVLFQIPNTPIMITEEGIYQGIFYSIRIALFIVISSLLTLTTSPMSLTDAIGRFLSPFKRFGIPAHAIAMMMSISLRLIPILVGEVDRIKKAQMSRGARFDGNIWRRLQNLIPLIIPLFLSSFRKANDLALAMEARCYRGDEGRTSYHVLCFQRSDAFAFLIVIGIGFSVLITQ